MPIRFDRSQAPVFVSVVAGETSSDEWRGHIEELTTILARAQPYAFVIDTSASRDRPNAAQRRIMADWMRAHAAEIRSFCRGGAFVSTSPIIRGVVTAIHWISPPPYVFATFATRSDAVAWCRARMADPERVGG